MRETVNRRQCQDEHPDPAATAYRCTDCALELTGLGHKFRRPGLCAHLGDQSRLVECSSCSGRVSLKVYQCDLRGETCLSRRLPGVSAVCDDCLQWVPAPPRSVSAESNSAVEKSADSYALVSPIGTGLVVEGLARKKPWEYPSTAVIPHLNTPDYLGVLIELLRLQSKPPYIVVVDTGSPKASADAIEQFRSEDVEIHFLRAGGYSHTSEPVCFALDVGLARANTPLIFLTHTDCFPTKRNALEWLGSQCGPAAPVVGWEMSERSWITNDWQGMVSHTFTMLHAATLRRIGATWHMGRARDQLGLGAGYRQDGWPDTETAFAYCLRAAGIVPKLLGREVNYQRQVTDWWDHARSFTGTQIYGKGTSQGQATSAYAGDALEDARRRVRVWKSGTGSLPQTLDELRGASPVKG